VTRTHNHPGPATPTAITGRTITARIRHVAKRLSDRIHAATDDRARARGWQVTQTPGRFGLTGRSYHDPRFAARHQIRQAAPAAPDERHE